MPIDAAATEHAEFRQTLLDIYLPRYGEAWLEVLDAGVFARIEAQRLFAFAMPPDHGDATEPTGTVPRTAAAETS